MERAGAKDWNRRKPRVTAIELAGSAPWLARGQKALSERPADLACRRAGLLRLSFRFGLIAGELCSLAVVSWGPFVVDTV